MTITCRACGQHLERDDAVGAAGYPAWYCRDTDACRERMWAQHGHVEGQP